MISTKPYFIRAIHEWCTDNGLTPYLAVQVDTDTIVPAEYVHEGEIILNISHDAAHHLIFNNDFIRFSARFNGLSHEIIIPVQAVKSIFAKETAQGMLFPPEETGETSDSATTTDASLEDLQPSPPATSQPGTDKHRHLQIVK
jgi:stringent starvation protein B